MRKRRKGELALGRYGGVPWDVAMKMQESAGRGEGGGEGGGEFLCSICLEIQRPIWGERT